MLEQNLRNPRNQAEAITFAHAQERDAFKELLIHESELTEILRWAELPVTKKVREAFLKYEEKILKRLKSTQWTEAEGKGFAFLCNYIGLLERIVGDCQKKHQSIQVKKQKREG